MTTSADANLDNAGPVTLSAWLSWRRKRFWGVVFLLIYTLAGFFLTPWLIERQLNKTVTDTGRSLTVNDIKTNPFLLTLDIQGLEILDADSTLLFSLGRFFANIQTSSLFHLALTFKTLSIEQPRVYEERFSGSDTRLVRFLADLAPQDDSSSRSEAGDDTGAGAPPPVYLHSLSVSDAFFQITDQTLDGYVAEMGPLSASLANIRTRENHVGSQAVDVLIAGTDSIRWEGDLQLIPFRSSGAVQVRASALVQTRQLLDILLPFELGFDSISAGFSYHMAVDEAGFSAALNDIEGEVLELEAVMKDADDAVVALSLIAFNGGSLEYPARKGQLEQLTLTGLTVRTALEEDGRISLLDLIPNEGPLAPSTAPDDDQSDSLPWVVSLGSFELNEGELNLTDRSVEPAAEVTLTPMAVTANGIDNQAGTKIPLSFETGVSSGGLISFTGDVIALPRPELQGSVTISDLQTAVAQSYVNRFVNVGMSDGALSLSAEITHNPEQLLAATGNLVYKRFEIEDLLRQEMLAAWESLRIDRFDLDMAAQSLASSEVEISGLFGRVAIAEDRSTNIGDLLITAPAGDGNEEDAPPAAIGDFSVTIGGVVLQAAALDFSDRSLPLPFEAAIREMNGTVSVLSTASAEPSEIVMEGQVNEFGLARINGTTQLLDPTNNTDINMVFRNLDISRLTPYTVQFAGYAINTGRLDLDLEYRLTERQMQGDNRVVIREMELGEKSDLPGAGSLPLRLAVALLTDSDGVIDLEVPVEGDLNNPEFKIGGVIWGAIGNLITKAVTAPFRFLGSLVGVDSEDFGTLSFQPGRADLSPPDREQLIKLSEAMLQRPELSVEVAGVWVEALDRPALQATAIAAAVDEWLDLNPGSGDELTTERDRRVLEALILQRNTESNLPELQAPFLNPAGDDPESQPVLDELAYLASLQAQLEASVEIDAIQFEDLARARGSAVAEGLRQGQPDAELRISEMDPASIEPGDDNSVPLELAVSGAD